MGSGGLDANLKFGTGAGGGCFGSPLSRIISDELGEITKKGHDAQDRQMLLLMYKFREDISS